VSITRIAWVKVGVAAVQGLELEVPVRNRGRSYRSGNDPGQARRRTHQRVYDGVLQASRGHRDVLAFPHMARREREILEHTVRTVAEQAVKADELVDEAKAAGGRDHPVTVHAKMLRLGLLKVKADLERELATWSLNCTQCGLDVHWVSGLGVSPGHWAHCEPAPHGEAFVR
jgi:hypothetical protein